MAGYGVKKMNWVRTPSAYQSMTAWREKRKAFQEKYETNMQNVVASLQTAWTDVGYNIGETAANKALARIQAEARAKQEKAAAAAAAEANPCRGAETIGVQLQRLSDGEWRRSDQSVRQYDHAQRRHGHRSEDRHQSQCNGVRRLWMSELWQQLSQAPLRRSCRWRLRRR
jgi:hypothetical protein